MPWPVLGKGQRCCPATGSARQKGARLCQMRRKTAGTNSTVDKWCREAGHLGDIEGRPESWGLSWPPLGKLELSWDKASSLHVPGASFPTAPFLPWHLHDGDVEGVGDVGGSGQVPAAVETLRVVVGPAHQHWLLWGGCQGKRKSNYPLRWGYHQVLNKGMSLHSQLLPAREGAQLARGAWSLFISCSKHLGAFVPCLQLTGSNERRSGRGGWQVPGEIVFKAVIEMSLMGRRCSSLDPIKLQCSWHSLPCLQGVTDKLVGG